MVLWLEIFSCPCQHTWSGLRYLQSARFIKKLLLQQLFLVRWWWTVPVLHWNPVTVHTGSRCTYSSWELAVPSKWKIRFILCILHSVCVEKKNNNKTKQTNHNNNNKNKNRTLPSFSQLHPVFIVFHIFLYS